MVSIPNGDRLYLELCSRRLAVPGSEAVSIPNGDRLYLEPAVVVKVVLYYRVVSIPNGDRLYLERLWWCVYSPTFQVSIPNGDRLYLELSNAVPSSSTP